jgi:UDP-N-acetylglucosamine--N-acetylmuramyl-(pentapeptide) pyrophosphoryl-undecaprenol N-acetylglucosamine transferase
MSVRFKMAIACGGTGGHVMPGLATALLLQERGHEVVLWLTGKAIEETSVAEWGGPIIRVPAQGFPGGVSWRSVQSAYRLWRSVRSCRRQMEAERPDVVLAMGSYASAGPVFAARQLGIPYVLHEANVLPGRAIRLFARRAAAVACHFESSRYYLPTCHIEVVGMPLRPELDADSDDAPVAGEAADAFTLLLMGGSHGAHALNEIGTEAVCRLHGTGLPIQVIHLAGVTDAASVAARYREAGVTARVQAFESHMGPVYKAADLALCRAGASTCAELSRFALPALLVPYPHAANDHQMANARALEKQGAVNVVAEKDLSVEWLVDYLLESIRNPGRLTRMREAITQWAPASGTRHLADLVERVASDG